jgi:hypothetical protein
MADQTVATIDTAPLPEVSSTFAQIAVLAALSATGTLATNILLPSLPQMAASLNVSTAAVTSAITVFLAVYRVRPARGRTDLGSLRAALAGADGLCGILRRQHLVRPRHRSAGPSSSLSDLTG